MAGTSSGGGGSMIPPDEAAAGESVPRLLLTPEEAARALGVGRSTLFKLLASGELGSVRIGTARRVSLAQLERFVDGLAADAGAHAGGRRRPNTPSVKLSPGVVVSRSVVVPSRRSRPRPPRDAPPTPAGRPKDSVQRSPARP
jgi:excisionase family DNA binding protein